MRSRSAKLVIALLALVSLLAGAIRAERPSALKLFPEESLVFVRIANAHEMGERIETTSTGQMLADPQLKPFVEALYGKAGELYASEAEGKLGISWDDLKNLPQGEVAFAVIARPERRPALLLLVDQGDEPSVADKLVDRALDLAEENGGEFSKEQIGGVEVTIVRDSDRENRMFGVFERDNTIVVATDANVLRNVLWHWDHQGEAASDAEAATADQVADNASKPEDDAAETQSEESKKEEAAFVPSRPIAQNDRFAQIVRNCRRPQDPPPQLMFYIDPIELLRNVGRGEGGMALAMGLFPSLGIDGLMAVGGAATYGTDEYDNLTQFHVLLENPRSGVMLLPAFQAGDTAPQPFVPLAVESYVTWNKNLRTTYDRVVALVDQYRYPGSVDKFVKEKISDKLGIDFVTQVIDNLKGRYTWMIGYERPTHFGQQHVVAAELNDEQAGKEALETVVKKFPEFFEERHFGNVNYYGINTPNRREDDDAPEERPFNPFVAIMDGYVFVGTSCQRFEQCIAARDGTAERLADSNDFARTSAVIGRETQGVTPVLFSISRFEETLRQWYDLLTSEKTRELIEKNKEGNPVLTALSEVLDEHKLPPFEALLPYTAPGGGIFFDTDSGYHAISFQLRNQTPASSAAGTTSP